MVWPKTQGNLEEIYLAWNMRFAENPTATKRERETHVSLCSLTGYVTARKMFENVPFLSWNVSVLSH
jgi:hypothetical protein